MAEGHGHPLVKFDLLEKFTITYKQEKKKSLKECKTNNKIQRDKNIEKSARQKIKYK